MPLKAKLETILDLILDTAFLDLEQRGCIFLAQGEGEGRELVMEVHRGLDKQSMQRCDRVSFGQCACGHAALGTDVLVSDCPATEGESCVRDIPHKHHCVPIAAGDRVHGVINLVIRPDHEPDTEETEFLKAIARTIAGMIERKLADEDKEQLQEQLIESEKMSALGRLTANVAHEIRNPLAALGGFATRLNRLLEGGDPKAKEYAEVIVAEARRLEDLLRGVLSLTKPQTTMPRDVALKPLLDGALQVFGVLAQERGIEVRTDFASVDRVSADPQLVRQAVDNLITNALEAMPDGGTLTMRLAEEARDGTRYVVVGVSDTGVGIAENKLSRVFEPFFTDRAEGGPQGIGLGLSITKRIMDDHAGLVTVDSTPGEGATFRLWFPVAKSTEQESTQNA